MTRSRLCVSGPNPRRSGVSFTIRRRPIIKSSAALASSGKPSSFRPEIQALRAVAVSIVVIYHFWPGIIRGGYVGVDVFFVVSGFLITAHLVRELENTGQIRVVQFWARRARRLLPASLVVLAFTAVAVLVVVPRNLWQQFFSEIGASSLYVQNWLLATNSVDYLAADNVPSPAQHFWSLSVEEQFYLVWPVLLGLAVIIARRQPAWSQRSVILVAVGALSIASLAYGIVATASQPSLAYFVTPTRAWEFGAGALLAVVAVSPVAGRFALRTWVSWLGFGIIAISALTYTGATPFPGAAALLPVAGTLMVIWAGAPDASWSPTRLMSLRPVQFLGDISYSVYLWHWALLVLAQYAFRPDLGLTLKLGIVATTVGLAILTKRYVEDPIRSQRFLVARRPKWTFAAVAGGMAVVLAISAGAWSDVQRQNDTALEAAAQLAASSPACFGAAAMDPDNQPCINDALEGPSVPSADIAADDGAKVPDCWAGDQDHELKMCSFGPDATEVPRIALVGDSHGLALLPAVMEIAKAGEWRVDSYLKGGCPWSALARESADKVFVDGCNAWRSSLNEALLSNDYDAILTTSYSRTSYVSVGDLSIDDQKVEGFRTAWSEISSRGTPILAVLDVPTFERDPAQCLSQAIKDQTDEAACDVPRDTAFGWPDPLREAVTRVPNAAAIDLTDLVCSETVCPARIGGVTVFRDKDHITATFSRTLAPYLYDRVSSALAGR